MAQVFRIGDSGTDMHKLAMFSILFINSLMVCTTYVVV